MANLKRLRGLRALLEDAVEHGTSAVERVHRATAARPFDVLDHIPPIAPASRGVRVIHDVTVAGVYETIRQVNHLVGITLSAAIDLYDAAAPDRGPGGAGRTSQAEAELAGPAAESPASESAAPESSVKEEQAPAVREGADESRG
jgi:hypothetical protein